MEFSVRFFLLRELNFNTYEQLPGNIDIQAICYKKWNRKTLHLDLFFMW